MAVVVVRRLLLRTGGGRDRWAGRVKRGTRRWRRRGREGGKGAGGAARARATAATLSRRRPTGWPGRREGGVVSGPPRLAPSAKGSKALGGSCLTGSGSSSRHPPTPLAGSQMRALPNSLHALWGWKRAVEPRPSVSQCPRELAPGSVPPNPLGSSSHARIRPFPWRAQRPCWSTSSTVANFFVVPGRVVVPLFRPCLRSEMWQMPPGSFPQVMGQDSPFVLGGRGD